MQLATEREVLERLNLYSGMVNTTNNSIRSALDGATSHLESILRTPLSKESRVDYFSRIRSPITTASSTETILWLSQRYLTGPVYVYESLDGNPLGAPEIGVTEAMDASLYFVNVEEGKITIPAFATTGYGVLAVAYTAGFTENEARIPSWLRNAAIESAIAIQHTQSQAHARKDKLEAAKPMLGMMYNTLNEHIVTTYGGLYPDRSSEAL